MAIKNYPPEVVRTSLLAIQVCVPSGYSDELVEDFANSASPTGIASKWRVCKEGHACLAGDPERVDCTDREGCEHVVLSC